MKQEMQKGIFVLQYKPNFCSDCPMFTWQDDTDPNNEMGECAIWGETNGGELRFNCPIKPMPQKKQHGEQEDEYDYWEIEGFNSCLEELEQ